MKIGLFQGIYPILEGVVRMFERKTSDFEGKLGIFEEPWTLGRPICPSIFLRIFELALPDDFRTLDWTEIFKYPELVYKKSQEFLQLYAN